MDKLFNLFKIRFSKLDEIISAGCKDINYGDQINVFINLEGVLDVLSQGDMEKHYRMNTKRRVMEMVSNIVNLAAHYRWFFSKNKLFSRIFIYLSHPFDSDFKNKRLIPEYRDLYQYKYGININNHGLHEVFNESIKIAKSILLYINNVYLICGDELEGSLIPSIITDEVLNHKGKNFIVTKDTYEYQYTIRDFNILRPKKCNESYMVTKNNVIEAIKLENRIKHDISIDHRYIPFILSLMGDRTRSIERVKRVGVSRVIKSIYRELNENRLTPGVYNINLLANIIKNEFRQTILNNYYCTDIETQYKLLNAKDKFNITDQIKDKFDNDGLKKVNEFFMESPINLMEITSGDRFLKGWNILK